MEFFGREHTIDIFLSSDDPPKDSMEGFVELYKPVGWIGDKIVHSYNFYRFQGIRPETNINNMICHFINKQRVFKLLEEHIANTGTQYDMIVGLRLDLVLSGKFNVHTTDDNTIYIPLGCDYIGGINDQMAHGNFGTMKKYMNIIETAIQLLESKISIPHPERLNCENIRYHKMNESRYALSYNISR